MHIVILYAIALVLILMPIVRRMIVRRRKERVKQLRERLEHGNSHAQLRAFRTAGGR